MDQASGDEIEDIRSYIKGDFIERGAVFPHGGVQIR
jgi:hypothetical protein